MTTEQAPDPDANSAPCRRPFIPAWLDEAGLTAADFRVLANLWRRAGRRGVCWPAVSSIARTCRLDLKTVWAVLRRLEAAGFLRRQKHYRNANEYVLTVWSIDPNGTPTQPVELTQTAPRQLTQTAPHPIDPFGTPPRYSIEGTPKKGVSEGTHTHAWPTAIPDDVVNRIAAALYMAADAVVKEWDTYHKRKLAYRDAPPATDGEVWDGFEGWVESHQPKRNSRTFEGRNNFANLPERTGGGHAPTNAAPTDTYPEPPNLREVVTKLSAAGDDRFDYILERGWAAAFAPHPRMLTELCKEASRPPPP